MQRYTPPISFYTVTIERGANDEGMSIPTQRSLGADIDNEARGPISLEVPIFSL